MCKIKIKLTEKMVKHIDNRGCASVQELLLNTDRHSTAGRLLGKKWNLLGVNQRLRVTPKCWYTPFYQCVLPPFPSILCLFYTFFVIFALKTREMLILTSERRVEHLFAGRNTQQERQRETDIQRKNLNSKRKIDRTNY